MSNILVTEHSEENSSHELAAGLDLLFGDPIANSPYFKKIWWKELGLGSREYNIDPQVFLEDMYTTLATHRINEQGELVVTDSGLESPERIAEARVLIDHFVQRELSQILEGQLSVSPSDTESETLTVNPQATAQGILMAVGIYDDMLYWGLRTGVEEFRVIRRQVLQEIVWAYERYASNTEGIYELVMERIKSRFTSKHISQPNIHKVNPEVARWYGIKNKVKMIPTDKFGSYI